MGTEQRFPPIKCGWEGRDYRAVFLQMQDPAGSSSKTHCPDSQDRQQAVLHTAHQLPVEFAAMGCGEGFNKGLC